jgi:rod shape-determining protein MreC
VAVLTDYLSRRGEILVLVLVIVLSVALMFLSRAEKDAVVRLVNDTAFTPIQVVLSHGRALTGLRSENDSLRAELARTRLREDHLREAGHEAMRLRRLLGFRERTRLGVIGARVIARSADRSGRDLKIDRGTNDGIQGNLAVVTPAGLVGKTVTAEPLSSFVRPLIAPGCRVSARLFRSRAGGILEWTADFGLHLSFLPLRAEVKAGDEIVTSGLGGVFPPGIVVGAVSRTETVPTDGSLRVLVEPAVDFRSLEEVFIVVETAPPTPFEEEDGPILDPGFRFEEPAESPEGADPRADPAPSGGTSAGPETRVGAHAGGGRQLR